MPSRAELERAFFLDDADEALIAKRRGDHSQLGFALQLTTVRFLGAFLADPLDVPPPVVAYLAEQLAIADRSCIKRYTERRTTRFEHAEEIKAAYGLREFVEVAKDLAEWVDARVWTSGDGPHTVFVDAVGWPSGRRTSRRCAATPGWPWPRPSWRWRWRSCWRRPPRRRVPVRRSAWTRCGPPSRR